MGVQKIIKIGDGTNGKVNYYYWDEYETKEEALYYAKRIKQERKLEGIKINYFILETQDSWFLPVDMFIVYFNKKLKIL